MRATCPGVRSKDPGWDSGSGGSAGLLVLQVWHWWHQRRWTARLRGPHEPFDAGGDNGRTFELSRRWRSCPINQTASGSSKTSWHFPHWELSRSIRPIPAALQRGCTLQHSCTENSASPQRWNMSHDRSQETRLWVWIQHLIPAVGSVRGVDEQRDDLGLGQKGSSSLWGLLRGEVVCALLEKKVCRHIGGHGEEVHVPENQQQPQTQTLIKVSKFQSHQLLTLMCAWTTSLK